MDSGVRTGARSRGPAAACRPASARRQTLRPPPIHPRRHPPPPDRNPAEPLDRLLRHRRRHLDELERLLHLDPAELPLREPDLLDQRPHQILRPDVVLLLHRQEQLHQAAPPAWATADPSPLGFLNRHAVRREPRPCPPADTLSEFGTPCANGTTLLASDTFTYDPAGNRTDKGAAVDAANRLRIFNNDSLSYDADGNLVRRFRIGDSTAFNQRLYWNSAGQLDSARTTRQSSTQTVHFGYDAAGRRVRKTVGADTVWYIYSGSRLVAEYSDAGAQLRRYTYLPGMDNPHSVYEGGAYHYYVTDGRANVRALVNANGAVEAEYRYTPYGDTVATSGSVANPVRFAGREFDSETGLYYNRARYYDPQLGRFVSEEGGGLSALNRYTYAGNDPVNGRDPSGRWCEWVQVQKQQAPPVAFASASSGDDHEGKVLYCEDTSGPGGFLSREEQAWLREMYYDPLFLNGSLGLDDPGYFNDGWGGGGAGSALGSGGFERPFPVVAMVRDPALQGCALPGVLLQTRDALRLTKVRWLLWRVAVIDYFMAPGGERIPIPGGGVGVYVGTAAFAEHLETAFGQVLCDAGVGFLTSWDLSS